MRRWTLTAILATACSAPAAVVEATPPAGSNPPAAKVASQASSTPEPVAQSKALVTQWPAIVDDGDKLFFVGNSYTANHGGLPRALQELFAIRAPPLAIETDAAIFYGQPLRAMNQAKATAKLQSGAYAVCVITSGTLEAMRGFAESLGHCEHATVFLTWPINPVVAGKHDLAEYQAKLAVSVADVRTFERESGATVIPAGIAHEILLRQPPPSAKRLDWIYWERNIHQNGVGILVNTYVAYAALLGESPEGRSFDFTDPYTGEIFVGERIATRLVGQKLGYDEITLTEDLRTQLQKVAWQAVVEWRNGTTMFDG